MSVYLEIEYVPVNCGPASSGGCGISFAMTRQFYDETKRTGRGWHCPNGHSRAWTDDSVENQLKRAEARTQHLDDQLRAAIADAEQTRVALLRDRQRFANGVCPCCNRSFENVRRHISAKHPDYNPADVAQSGKVRFRCSCGTEYKSLRGLRTHQGHARSRRDWARPDAPEWSAHLTRV